MKELSIVRLKEGREGTVQIVYFKDGVEAAYLVEIEDESHDFLTVTPDHIEKVLCEPTQP